MADKVEYPLSSFPEKSVLDFKKMNIAGVGDDPAITKSYQEALQAQNDLATSLEQRFAQPNYFKIAAGFAKPQLGGFLASLGSASEAMGENVESQRAIQPTIARMRAETAAGQLPLAQRTKQQELFKEWQQTKDIKLAGQIYSLDPTSSFAEAVKGQIDAAATQVATATEAEGAMQQFPNIDLNAFIGNDQPKKTEKAKNDLISNISSKGYYSKDDLKLKSINDLLAIADKQNNQFFERSVENAKDAASTIDIATTQLQNLGVSRQLASSPRLDKLLGLQSGTTALSALFGWIASGKEGDYSKLDELARKLAQDDPRAFSDFQILQKSLATSLATAREGVQNPSVAIQSLLSKTTPDVRMSKIAILKLLDLQANEYNQQLNRANLFSSSQDAEGKQLDPNKIRTSQPYKNITTESNDRKKAILDNKFMDMRLPDFYSPYHSSSNAGATVVPGQTIPEASSANTQANQAGNAKENAANPNIRIINKIPYERQPNGSYAKVPETKKGD